MATKNPITVVLSIDSQSHLAIPYEKFCGAWPAEQAQTKLLFLNCSEAADDGRYLRVKIHPRNDEPLSLFRIPNNYVLLIFDSHPPEKSFGFVPP